MVARIYALLLAKLLDFKQEVIMVLLIAIQYEMVYMWGVENPPPL